MSFTLALGVPRRRLQRGFHIPGKFVLWYAGRTPDDHVHWKITDWLAHVPKEVIAKSFQANITAFDHIPSRELYIFPSGPFIHL